MSCLAEIRYRERLSKDLISCRQNENRLVWFPPAAAGARGSDSFRCARAKLNKTCKLIWAGYLRFVNPSLVWRPSTCFPSIFLHCCLAFGCQISGSNLTGLRYFYFGYGLSCIENGNGKGIGLRALGNVERWFWMMCVL